MSREGRLPLFTWWWKLWLLFGFSLVLIDFFSCHISCNIVSLKSSASHGLGRSRWQKVGSVYLILTILPPSLHHVWWLAQLTRGRCGPLISNHRGRHDRFHPQLRPSTATWWAPDIETELVQYHFMRFFGIWWILFVCICLLGITFHPFILMALSDRRAWGIYP